ncbi:hypothetical protein [Streptomyces hypolithicus]
MRALLRPLFAVLAATGIAFTTGTSAHASGPDITDYNVGQSGKSVFKTYGDHLYISDLRKDGHSVVTILEQGTRYYYWNRDGVDTTRHVDLDLPEGVAMTVRTCLADWQGSPTAGIRWDTCSNGAQTES